jgi:hypothetical protein
MRNLAYALRNATISGSLAAQSLEALAAEVEELQEEDEEDTLTPEQAKRILQAIREEDARQAAPLKARAAC